MGASILKICYIRGKRVRCLFSFRRRISERCCDDIAILPTRKKTLQALKEDGWILVGASNQSGVAKGEPTAEMAQKCFDRTNELLGVDIEYMFCPHKSGATNCWCRKPMAGMALHFLRKYNPGQVLMVGDMTSDKTFATRASIPYENAQDFFGRYWLSLQPSL